jgi:hypothetical protein
MKPSDPTKRGPTLADRFATHRYPAHERYLAPGILEAMQQKTRMAHKFVLDEQATTRVAHVVRDIPDLILREHAFARAPFELSWIEFPHWLYWREIGNNPELQDDKADHTIGYLIDHGVVTVVSGGIIAQPTMGPYPTVLRYYLNTEWDERDQSQFLRDAGSTAQADFIDKFLWGSSYSKIDPALRDQLRKRNSVRPTPYSTTMAADATRRWIQGAHHSGAGELRTVIALLLMLNRPMITRYSNVEPGRGFHKGKLMPYMAHTTVTIDLDAVPTLKLMSAPEGDGTPRRRHEVRGHYCHDREARDYLRIAGCMHDWRTCDDEWTPAPAIPDAKANHWLCAVCGGKRWWRAEHERGDAGLGFVQHDSYAVTAS